MDTPIYKLTIQNNERENFEGPLALILHLLSKRKIEISELQISVLCGQFLDWLTLHPILDVDAASEFASMASHLVYLKSKNLVIAGDYKDEEIDEFKLQLEKEQLEQERRKLLGPKKFLLQRSQNYIGIFTKPPEILEQNFDYFLPHKIEELSNALLSIFEKTERRKLPPAESFAKIVGKEPYPIADKINLILERLKPGNKILLKTFFREQESRSELVASFLAVLEMCRQGDIVFSDDENFITLRR